MNAVSREVYKHLLFENRKPKKSIRDCYENYRYKFYIRLNKDIENLRSVHHCGGIYHYMVVLLDVGDLVYCSAGMGEDSPINTCDDDKSMVYIGSGIVHHFEGK